MCMLFCPETWLSLMSLVALELILSVDNLLVITLLASKLPNCERTPALITGIGLALVLRLTAIFAIGWIMSLSRPLFSALEHSFTGREIILIVGGAFLMYKAVKEMYGDLDGKAEPAIKVYSTAAAVVIQITVVNFVFSIDSMVTAVGLTTEIWVMVTALVLSTLVLMAAARALGNFIERHPGARMLALSFLVMIGMTLVVDGFRDPINHAFAYPGMALSVAGELPAEITQSRRRDPEPPPHKVDSAVASAMFSTQVQPRWQPLTHGI
jgi:predicted tellurium resistance membrane protein TerC